jgi:hypothetical protein
MEHGFPRSYVDTTPQEILYDHDRVLGARVKIMSTGETVLRQPRLETTLYQQISGIGDLVQLKRQEGKQLVLESAFMVPPYRMIVSELIILGLSSYIFFTSDSKAAKIISASSGIVSLITALKDIYSLSQEPKVAYQTVKPSFEV